MPELNPKRVKEKEKRKMNENKKMMEIKNRNKEYEKLICQKTFRL